MSNASEAFGSLSAMSAPERRSETMDRIEGPWEVDDIVQVSPGHDEAFGASMLVVTEVKSWGVQGYVQMPGKNGTGGQAYYRLPYKQADGVTPAGIRVGTAHWLFS